MLMLRISDNNGWTIYVFPVIGLLLNLLVRKTNLRNTENHYKYIRNGIN